MAEKQTAGRNELGTFAPKFAELNDDVLFGDIWSRENQLSLRDRFIQIAENYLLSAESIITDIMGTDNEYTKSVYKYLYNLYARWHKTELAEKYRTCLISQ